MKILPLPETCIQLTQSISNSFNSVDMVIAQLPNGIIREKLKQRQTIITLDEWKMKKILENQAKLRTIVWVAVENIFTLSQQWIHSDHFSENKMKWPTNNAAWPRCFKPATLLKLVSRIQKLNRSAKHLRKQS